MSYAAVLHSWKSKSALKSTLIIKALTEAQENLKRQQALALDDRKRLKGK